jgi:hypothetical protein
VWDWQTFYATTVGVGGGLFALLFTALQVRENLWRDAPLKRAAAVCALAELFVVVLVSLLALTPHQLWGTLAGGVLGLGMTLWYWRSYRHSSEVDPFDANQSRLNWISLVVYSALVIAACLGGLVDWNGTARVESSVPYLLVWLTFSGSTEIGYLLMFVSEPTAASSD